MKKAKKKNYFDVVEEFAVVKFLESNDQEERNKIFNEFLRAPLYQMTEAIIKTYKLNRAGMSIEEQIDDTLTFLLIKFDKYNPERGTKAYSYYQTIVKNYLVLELKSEKKARDRKISYEDISSSLEESDKFSYELEEEKMETFDFINVIVSGIKNELENGKKIKINEEKVGYALIDILENWEKIISKEEKSNILAKNKVLFEIREYTFLNSKEVTTALKRFKKLYEFLHKKTYL